MAETSLIRGAGPPGAVAIIVAAGRGRRLGGGTPKQYLPLNGPCALRRSVETFLGHPRIDAVRTVIHPDDRELHDAALAGLDDPKLLPAVHGGASRAHSVRLGLEAFETVRPARVVVHDAARPFVPAAVIEGVVTALDSCDGASAAVPIVDALWQVEHGRAQQPVPREGLWRAQTPQGFAFDRLLAAHRMGDGSAADDVAVARAAGIEVALVEGHEGNYKITTAADLARALSETAPTGACEPTVIDQQTAQRV